MKWLFAAPLTVLTAPVALDALWKVLNFVFIDFADNEANFEASFERRQAMELVFANDGVGCLYLPSRRERQTNPPGALIFPITLGRWSVCLRNPHQRRRRVSGGLHVHFLCFPSCRNRRAYKENSRVEGITVLINTGSKDRRNKAELIHEQAGR